MIKAEQIKPKILFLVDSLGALLSAFLLGVILYQYDSFFGMPQTELGYLAALACLFAVYSFLGYLKITVYWRSYLRIIAIINLSYCVLTLALVFYHWEILTSLGILYFVLEIIIVTILARVEWMVANTPTIDFQ